MFRLGRDTAGTRFRSVPLTLSSGEPTILLEYYKTYREDTAVQGLVCECLSGIGLEREVVARILIYRSDQSRFALIFFVVREGRNHAFSRGEVLFCSIFLLACFSDRCLCRMESMSVVIILSDTSMPCDNGGGGMGG